MDAIIETSGLTRSFGRGPRRAFGARWGGGRGPRRAFGARWGGDRCDAVRDLDLRVEPGSIFALIGPNGAGKTTTIKLLMNLMRATTGSARVLGCDSRRLGVPEFRRIGYVSENQRVPDWMTPGELLDYCQPLYPTWDASLARRLQQDLGLFTSLPLRRLSRGTRMKAVLLASLAFRPELLVLDEPFTGLDPLVRDELIRALLEAPSERAWTVFVSSHDVDEVERLADWVGFMNEGRLVFAEPVSSLLARFRMVDVTAADGAAPQPPSVADWLIEGHAGRTLRFVDTAHDRSDADLRIASAFPGAAVQVSPLTLREIFVALARSAGRVERR